MAVTRDGADAGLPADVVVSDRSAAPTSRDGVVLLMDKPKGWSSFDVIRRLRRVLGVKKIGHAGTLDPMATGLLICLVGRRATKLMTRFMEMPKTYTGTLRLGETTASYDAESPVEERSGWQHLTADDLERAREAFVGEITQQPPIYSAIKVDGERLYKKARRGETAEVPTRRVNVYRFELTAWNGSDVSFEVDCSKGTYIRSIAHDFGQALGVGGHLVALRRTAIGAYRIDDAWSVEALEQALDGEVLR